MQSFNATPSSERHLRRVILWGALSLAVAAGIVAWLLLSAYFLVLRCDESCGGSDPDHWEWTAQFVVAVCASALAVTAIVLGIRRHERAFVGLFMVAVVICLGWSYWATSGGFQDESGAAGPRRDAGPTGVLEVHFTYAERTALYAEGARHYLRVIDLSGPADLLRDQGTDQGPGEGYRATLRLPPGRYRVITFQRGCDYTADDDCRSTIGAAQDRCRAVVKIIARERTVVRIAAELPEPCRTKVEQG